MIWQYILLISFNGLSRMASASGGYVLDYSAKSAWMSASKINKPTTPADRDPTLTFDKNRHRHFSSNGMDQQEADDKHHCAGYAINGERSRLRSARPQNG
jgi:hypothetical protein